MPIPQVTCSVCGQTVNKAQTLATGNGKRACRSHEGTQQAALDQQTKDREAKEAKEAKRRAEKFKAKKNELPSVMPNPRCHSCNKEGLVSQAYALEILKGMAKFKVTYGRECNILNPEEAKKAFTALKDLCCIHVVDYAPKMRLSYLHRQMAKTFGWAGLCTECCTAQGIKIASEISNEQFMKSMVAASVIYDTVVAPALEQEARQEISAKN